MSVSPYRRHVYNRAACTAHLCVQYILFRRSVFARKRIIYFKRSTNNIVHILRESAHRCNRYYNLFAGYTYLILNVYYLSLSFKRLNRRKKSESLIVNTRRGAPIFSHDIIRDRSPKLLQGFTYN